MDSREKKAWLGQYRFIAGQVSDLLEERQVWKEKMTRITPNYSGESGGGGDGDKLTAVIIGLERYDRQIADRLGELEKTRRQIERAVASVPDPDQRELLRLRYIRGLSWRRVAEKMNYDESWVFRLHGRALLALRGPGERAGKK